MNRGILALAILLIMLAMITGGLFLLRPAILDLKREQSEDAIITMIEDGQTTIADVDIPEIEGEETEFSMKTRWASRQKPRQSLQMTGKKLLRLLATEP